MNVALWTVSWGVPDYYLFESEARAADYAAWLMDELGDSSPLGVQYQDGRALPLKSWPAYADEQRRREAERKAKAALPPVPQPPMRTVRDPFSGRALEIEADEPAWLGIPADQAAGGSVVFARGGAPGGPGGAPGGSSAFGSAGSGSQAERH